jgi:acetylornithine deacetylase/succinyl-diaminopimelate desuccinylase-like protein
MLNDLQPFIDRRWDEELLPRLIDYIKVPAKSPAFDPSWAAHGHLHAVIRDAHAWCRAQEIAGMHLEVVSIDGRTPCLFFDVPATGTLGNDKTVLFYGHLDKQPEMDGWRPDLGPWIPKLDGDKLYGRGGADDGYAIYAALTIIAALDRQGIPRPRCVGLIESCEESGSPDLPAYLDLLAPRFGDVQLVAGLDSGCGNYDQLWVTTSLRGLLGGVLTVEVLTEGVHSGTASGLVPSSFRIARQLLDRIDESATGRVLHEAFHVAIPDERLQQAVATGHILGDDVWKQFPWVSCNHTPHGEIADAHAHMQPTTTDPVEAILNRTWRPALSVTGADGLPPIASAGNVLRPKTSLKLSMRLPPTVDGQMASRALQQLLERDPPYGAKVTYKPISASSGWNAPVTAPWLLHAVDAASNAVWGRDAGWIGEGGSIPFMNMLGAKFPRAQFLITGVLGPKSNAHGPNEFLHVPYVKRLTSAVADIVTRVPG